MKSLFKNRMRRQKLYLAAFVLWSVIITAAIAYLYVPPSEGQITFVESIKKEAPLLANVLNIKHGLTPQEHFASLALGFIMPLFLFFYILSSVRRLQADIVLNREYYFFIQTSFKQSRIVLINFLSIVIGLLLHAASVMLALFVSSFILEQWTFSFAPFFYIMFLLFSEGVFTAGFLLLGAAISQTGKISFWFPFLIIMWFILPRLADAIKNIYYIKYLSPFSIADIWKMLSRPDFGVPFIFLLSGLAFVFISAIHFNRREFIAEED